MNVPDAPRRQMVIRVGDKFCVMDSGSGLYLQSASCPDQGAHRYYLRDATEIAAIIDWGPQHFGPLNP